MLFNGLQEDSVWIEGRVEILEQPDSGSNVDVMLSAGAAGVEGRLCAVDEQAQLHVLDLDDGQASQLRLTDWPLGTTPSTVRFGGGGAPDQTTCRGEDDAVVHLAESPARAVGGVGLRLNRARARYHHVSIYRLGGPYTGTASTTNASHRYRFEGGVAGMAVDDTGTADGVLMGGAVLDNGALDLDGAPPGTESYVDLPNGIISANPSLTVEAWVDWRGTGQAGFWQRVWDFGTNSEGEITGPGGGPFTGNGSAFIQLSPENSLNEMRVTAYPGNSANQAHVNAAPPPTGQAVHLTVVYDSSASLIRLFQDGSEVAAEPWTYDLTTLIDNNVWIGRSNYAVDASFDGRIDELRIHGRALSRAEVLASFYAGPDADNPQP